VWFVCLFVHGCVCCLLQLRFQRIHRLRDIAPGHQLLSAYSADAGIPGLPGFRKYHASGIWHVTNLLPAAVPADTGDRKVDSALYLHQGRMSMRVYEPLPPIG
jgi:hypothetical protein